MEFKILYQELTNSTEMIRSMLKDIDEKQAPIKPSPGKWSILEVVCHLHDEEREDFREHLDFILHRQNEEWHGIAPTAWVKLRKYNQQNFKTMQRKFFNERKKSLTWLHSLKRVDWNIKYTSKRGSMSAGEMLACWIAHDNLHVRQLVELRRMHLERITRPYAIRYAGDW